MLKIKEIILNKNRGWRGLAELVIRDATHTEQSRMIFSFSENVWRDMLDGAIVIQDEDAYYVLHFNNTDQLPKRTQQRSVLIKNFKAEVTNVNRYLKSIEIPTISSTDPDCNRINNFKKNNNNHTTSDWNCIGLRVIPMI